MVRYHVPRSLRALITVAGLARPEMLVEVQGIAVLGRSQRPRDPDNFTGTGHRSDAGSYFRCRLAAGGSRIRTLGLSRASRTASPTLGKPAQCSCRPDAEAAVRPEDVAAAGAARAKHF